MIPYFYCPFAYDDRMNVPKPLPPMPMPMQPMPAMQLPQAMPPMAPPQMAPMPNMQPPMFPMQPIAPIYQPMMPMFPDMSNMGNMGNVTSPANLGNVGNVASPANLGNVGNVASPANLGNVGNVASPANLGNVANPANTGNVGDIGKKGDKGSAPSSKAGDPPPVLSNNPAVVNLTLFKELTAYPNYGNPSGNADILYAGNRGTWTFDIPAHLLAMSGQRGQLIIRAVLDDHENAPPSRYSARITINGVEVHNGRVPLEHGTPANSRFINWRQLTFDVRNLSRTNRVTIENTSAVDPNDWIGFDWMEMRLMSR